MNRILQLHPKPPMAGISVIGHLRSRGTEGETRQKGFSLVELLTVIAIMSLLTALAVPAFNNVSNAYNLTSSANTLAGCLQRARTFAMARNTYVWVGLYEENADAPAPPTNVFPYTGVGRVVLGMAASVDGTSIANGSLAVPQIVQLDRLVRLQNVHLADLPAPASPSSTESGSSLLSTRPYPANGEVSIYGATANPATNPLIIGQYKFYLTIRFSPSGEATADGSSTLEHINEIGLQPTHGDTLDQKTTDLAAVQLTGIGGNLQVYRN